MLNRISRIAAVLLALLTALPAPAAHKNFKVSVYVRAYEVQKMKDREWLESSWKIISDQLDVDKIYLETHRDLLIVDDETLEQAKAFFLKQGLEVAGGITYTINESNEFETFSYSDPEDRAMVRRIAEHTARHFDEFLLDDFFFTSSKKDVEIEAKGNRSWTEYRLALLKEAGQSSNTPTGTTISRAWASAWRTARRFSTACGRARKHVTRAAPSTCRTIWVTTSCATSSTSPAGATAAAGWTPAASI